MRSPANHALPVAALLFSLLTPAQGRAETPPLEGPVRDFPVVVGEPFTLGGTTWTPADQPNYDAVGLASIGEGKGVTAAHKTLPLPSYVEVTALGSGRTILVRLERRGPMVNDALVELSPEAAAQLGMAEGTKAPVRLRRVNSPEVERAMLRSGGKAPERMATPEGLLKVLRRKLADQSPLLPPPSTPPTMPLGPPPVASAPSAPQAASPKAAQAPAIQARAPMPQKPSNASPASGARVVQVGAFSVEDNARKVAARLGAHVSASGRFWRVRMGPFANGAQATAALEKAKAAGYSDARIQRAD